jgi:S-adenosylmethionine:tRNA ribosyltransferase-isomerase
MRVDAFDYELPAELIAQRPAERRELARLMALPQGNVHPEHRRIASLPELIAPGTLVVVNDTRVVPARLLGRKRPTGGRVELLLVRRVGMAKLEGDHGELRDAEVWRALGKASKPLRFGADVEVPERPGTACSQRADPSENPGTACSQRADPNENAGTAREPAALMARLLRRAGDDGLLEVALWTPSGEPVAAAVRRCGRVPLPPYIRRDDEPGDVDRYQTVYARHDGAVAAPTAGLHLTTELLEALTARRCEIASVTLHVGLGTFQPVTVDDLDEHPMHAESFVVLPAAADAVARARERGAPVVAVGTTTVRALESAADPARPGHVIASSGETRLLVQPGHRWSVVDGLLTNFHLPRSTLLALVCAFGGTERVLVAYRAAVAERYRFYSYGDAMLLWRSR